MTLQTFPYTGAIAGTDVTVANSGHPSVSPQAPNFVTRDGYTLIHFEAGASQEWVNATFAATDNVSYADVVYVDVAASAAGEIWYLRDTPTNVKQLNILTNTTRLLQLRNDADANVGTPSAFTLGAGYIRQIAVRKGTTTTNGQIRYKVTPLAGGTALIDYTGNAENTGTTQFASFQWGDLTNATTITMDVGRVSIATGTDALDGSGNLKLIDPYTVAPVVPSVYFATSPTVSVPAQMYYATSATTSVRVDLAAEANPPPMALGSAGVPSATPTWSDEFTTRSIATDPNDATSLWMPVDPTWQLTSQGGLNPGYVDPAATNTWLEPSRITVANGIATVTAQRTPDARKADIEAAMVAQQSGTVAPPWMGGVLISNPRRQKFTSGYFAAKLRLPNPGKGIFPAFWLYATEGSNDPVQGEAEIDVLEVFGHATGSPYTVTQHYGKGDHTVDRPPVTVATVAQETTGWHVYGCDYQPALGYIRHYRDGVLTGETTGTNATWYTGALMGIRLNLSMDATWFGANLSDQTTPAEPRMEVDWVARWATMA